MKKLLLVLAIGAFVACNDTSDDDTITTDTATSVTVDTNTTVAPMPDTTAMPIDTAGKADTAQKK